MYYDYIIVGSGLFGSVFAQQAKQAGRTVLVIEQRNHIGGNCYSTIDEETGINVHQYGTHIFHTNDSDIWSYVRRFTEFNSYKHRVLTTHRDRVYSMPIILGTINAFYGINLKPAEVPSFLAKKRVDIRNPANFEEKAISLIGEELYEAFIKGYTLKQWDRDPKELPASVISRLPVRPSYDDSYFNDRFQGIPLDGYTPMFERMLHDIPVERSVDFLADRDYWIRRCGHLVYTGPIDRFFDYQFGRLNWRSVRFETQRYAIDDFQGTSVMNYADRETPYTRIHEPKHLHPEKKLRENCTLAIREFSQEDLDAPYYTVNTKKDQEILACYQSLQREETKVTFGGRLAEYRYYDMHQVIASALQKSRQSLQAGPASQAA